MSESPDVAARPCAALHLPGRAALLGLATLAALAIPSAAAAAAPANDHYLASTIIRTDAGGFPREWSATADTTEATTQADLFQPNRDGAPLGGGPPEPTACGPAVLGKTVWWDFTPPLAGGVQLTTQGFDSAIAVYEFDPGTSRIGRQVACAATPGVSEMLTLPGNVRAGQSYTVQVGGAAGPDGTAASGPVTFGFSFFPDRDDDGVLDVLPDRCPDLPGVIAYGGCPPTLRPSVSYQYAGTPSGVTLRRLVVGSVPAGATVRVDCCGHRQTATVGAGGKPVTLGALAGRRLRAGATLRIRVTRGKSGGEYAHGAIGAEYRFKVMRGRLGARVTRCLLPGSSTPRKGCRRAKR